MKIENTIKITTLITVLFFICSSCTVNINTEDECLECSFINGDRTVSEEICGILMDQEKKEMRDRMQMEADSLDVILTCITK